jgi:XTP/dITP diphosphohydrolase
MSVEYHNMFHLLIATTNQGKVKEVKALLRSLYIKISSLDDFPEFKQIEIPETGETFIENAAIKAQAYGRLTGLPTLADDSGISVAALGNQPGVHSKRYADTDQQRIDKLLEALKDVPSEKRQAHFTCALVLYDPSSDRRYISEGVVEGSITQEPLGNHGFGYDPIFFCPEINMTFAEAGEDLKNTVSHRARAFEKMKKIIKKRTR